MGRRRFCPNHRQPDRFIATAQRHRTTSKPSLGHKPGLLPCLRGEGFAIPEVGGGAERSNARGQMRGTGQLRALHALYLTVFPRSPYLAPQGLLSQGFFLSGRTIVG
jgi:hypothetical protein